MIQLVRPEKPAELTDEKVLELTQKFIDSGKKDTVWNVNFIKNLLAEMSNDKCAFCERMPKEGGAYLEVEHFHDKNTYPEEVVIWTNLLPSCKQCNVKKGTFNTKTSIPTLVNPVKDVIKNYLKMDSWGKLTSKNNYDNGKKTITQLELNDYTKGGLLDQRILVCKEIHTQLNSILQKIKKAKKKSEHPLLLQELMSAISPITKFTAAKATALLHSDSDYWEIKELCEQNNIWTDELTQLEKSIELYSLAT